MNDDLISRQAVLDMLEDINNHIIDGCGYNHKWCVDWVKGLSSAVKHGEWAEREVDADGRAIDEWQSAKCSACGLYHTTPYLYYFDEFKYCPNCGARMDERKES